MCNTGQPAMHPFTRVLTPEARETEYRRVDSSVRHAGQLKLILSEIEFLTPFNKEDGTQYVVVYAGASPGLHIQKLAGMFRRMHFILVDPQPSFMSNGEYVNIEVICDFMTDELSRELAAKYSSGGILFISNVRIGADSDTETDREQQIRIQRDMDIQKEWNAILQPVSSMFKFRLPWDLTQNTHYLSGQIQLPIFGKKLTHETRLIVQAGAPDVPYENRRYERQMAYFNQYVRPSTYEDGRCYDCVAFRQVVSAYLGTGDADLVDTMCREIEQQIQAACRIWARKRQLMESDK